MPATTHHALRLRPGQDLRQELAAFAKTQQLSAAWIVTAVGSLTDCHLRFAGRDRGFRASGPFELVSLTGTLSPDGPHLHACLSDGDGQTIGGHLLDGTLVYTTCEIVVGATSAFAFTRELDPASGYAELVVRPASGESR